MVRRMKILHVLIAVGLSVFATAGNAADDRVIYPGGEGPGKGKHVVLVSGDEEYHSAEALTQLGKILSVHHGFKCTVLFAIDPQTGLINPVVRDNIPGLETLAEADLMVLFTRWRILPDSQLKHIHDYVLAGKPIVGMRTATHPFAPNPEIHPKMRQWSRMMKRKPKEAGLRPEFTEKEWGKYGRFGDGYYGANKKWQGGFGRYVIGEMWVAHHGHHKHESTLGLIAPGAKKHPIVRGVKDGDIWGSTDVYTVGLTGDSKPLVLGQVMARKGEYDAEDVNFGMRPDDGPPVAEKNDPMMPVAWTKTYKDHSGKQGRVFTTTMGAATDLESDGLRRLIVNGVYWSLKMEKRIPKEGTKVDLVGKFEPSQYGFSTMEYWTEKNLRPKDFTLDR